MRRRYSWLPGLSLAALFTLLLAANLIAEDKAKPMNVQGRVQMLNKNAATFMVEMTGGVRRKVTYSPDTKFLYGHSKDNKPGSLDQVKESNYISCSGSYDSGKVELKATQCVYRETK